MRRIVAIAIGSVTFVSMSLVLASATAMAEPIAGADTLSDPWQTSVRTQHLAEAQARFHARDYDGALALLQRLAKENADMPPAQVLMAILYADASMVGKAKTMLEQAINDTPDDPEAYLLMASIAIGQHDFAKAEPLLRKAHELMATFDKSAKRKGEASAHDLQRPGDGGRSPQRLGRVQSGAGRMAEVEPAERSGLAAARLRHVPAEGCRMAPGEIARRPSSIPSCSVRKSSWRSFAGASAMQKAPRNGWMPRSRRRRMTSRRTWPAVKPHWTGAKSMRRARMLRRCFQIAPKDPATNFLRGVVAMLEKEYTAAEMYFDTALKLSPHSFAFKNNLALALAQQDDDVKKHRALEFAEANVQQCPYSADAAATYGWTLYRVGRRDDAIKALCGAASIVNSDVDAAYFMARIDVDRGQKDEAAAMLESALRSRKVYIFRQDAQDLLDQLKK